MTTTETTKNYNNNDIRCGMLMTVNVNCNYITYSYAEQQEGGELEYIGKEGLKEKQLENFWSNYNMKATNTIEKWGMNTEELIYLFEEHIEDWKGIFEWRMEEDIAEQQEEERKDCEECGDIGIECIWSKEQGLMVCEECFKEEDIAEQQEDIAEQQKECICQGCEGEEPCILDREDCDDCKRNGVEVIWDKERKEILCEDCWEG